MVRGLRSGCSIALSCLAVLHPAHLQAEEWRWVRHLRHARRAQALMKCLHQTLTERSLPEVGSLLLQTRQVNECQRRQHQRLASSEVAGESRCLLSLPEAVSRPHQILPVDECQRRHLQSPAFFAVVVAVAHLAVVAVVAVAHLAAAAHHPVLRQLVPGVAGAAAQTSS